MGVKIKVKDMKVGYTYTFVDETIEERFIKDGGKWPPAGMIEPMSNTAVLQSYPYYNEKTGKYEFSLFPCQMGWEFAYRPARSGSGNVEMFRTGKRKWFPHANYSIRVAMAPDDEIIEANPFPVGLYRGKNVEMVWLPDPQNWVTTNEPYNKKTDYVDVWDDTDAKILIVSGIISFLFIIGGPTSWSLAIMTWLLTGLGIHGRHKKVREDVLRDREELGVRGGGLDNYFRWRK